MVLAVVLLVSPAVLAGNSHFTSSVEYAASDSLEPNGSYISVWVGKQTVNTPAERTTYLALYRSICDAAECTGFLAEGTIPSSDFSAAGIHAELSTHIAAGDDFRVSAWRLDYETMTTTERRNHRIEVVVGVEDHPVRNELESLFEELPADNPQAWSLRSQ